MAYPTTLIPIADYINKGVSQTSESHTITFSSSYYTVTLNYIPQGRFTNTNGVVIPSSITVMAGSTSYAEVSEASLLVTNTFYADSTAKKLYFHSSNNNTGVLVTYLTRGDIVDASIVNTIQNDVRALERFIAGTATASGASLVVNLTNYTAGITITSIVVIANTNQGAVPAYTLSNANKTITFTTANNTDTVNYILYINPVNPT